MTNCARPPLGNLWPGLPRASKDHSLGIALESGFTPFGIPAFESSQMPNTMASWGTASSVANWEIQA
jgi:hypothetical protein